MYDMRIRLTELMAASEGEVGTAYQIAKRSEGRISIPGAYRLLDANGKPARVELETLEALCDVFRCGPDKLLVRDVDDVPTPPKKRKPKPR